MKIAQPPMPLKHTFNLRKQQQVFDHVYLHTEDTVLKSDTEAKFASVLDYHRAHDKEYSDAVVNGIVENGFNSFDRAITVHAMESVNCMFSASYAAINGGNDGKHVAFAPCSGFHHAGHGYGGGFCTFNGLMIAALKLRLDGLLSDGLLIIDGDGHYGDGTQDIIDKLELDWVTHCSLDYGSVGGSNVTAANKLLDVFGSKKSYSLIMYQAGADCHKADPAASGYLADDQWDSRDGFVFEEAKATNSPIVWNLAGGYNGNKTLVLHNRTFATALQVYEPESVRIHPVTSLIKD